jgi:uncharacterized protein (DUF1778 family)
MGAAELRAERSERLGFRVTPQRKALLTKAAALAGEDVTTFVLSRALHDAWRIVQVDSTTTIAAEAAAAYRSWLERDPEVIPDMASRLVDVDPFPVR